MGVICTSPIARRVSRSTTTLAEADGKPNSHPGGICTTAVAINDGVH
jgi:hypothetical protein